MPKRTLLERPISPRGRALLAVSSPATWRTGTLAQRVLLPYQAALIRVPRLCRWLLERGLPGALGYFNARTRYFDDVVLEEARVGLEQLVILGAGFDSRSIRFSDALRTARVF